MASKMETWGDVIAAANQEAQDAELAAARDEIARLRAELQRIRDDATKMLDAYLETGEQMHLLALATRLKWQGNNDANQTDK